MQPVPLDHRVFRSHRAAEDVRRRGGIGELEQRLESDGVSTVALWEHHSVWPDYGKAVEGWREACADALQRSIEALLDFVDVPTVVLAASAPESVYSSVVSDLDVAMADIDVKVCGVRAPAETACSSGLVLPFVDRRDGSWSGPIVPARAPSVAPKATGAASLAFASRLTGP